MLHEPIRKALGRLAADLRRASQGALWAVFTVSTTADNGPGSLRQALLDANASPGADTILVPIKSNPAHVILVTAPLPDVTGPISMDARVEVAGVPDFPVCGLVIEGTPAGAGTHGLTLAAGSGGSSIKGLGIRRFGGHGARILSNGNTVESCQFGQGGAGNGLDGLAIFGSGNTAFKCQARDNGQNGFDVFGAAATLTTLSRFDAAGNGVDGVAIQGGASGIFLGATGGAAESSFGAGNGRFGIGVTNGSFVAVKGVRLSGNGRDGIAVVAPSSNVAIGGAAVGDGNLIAENRGFGIDLFRSSNNQVLNNVVASNRIDGIAVFGGENNRIGDGTGHGANRVEGNEGSGIVLSGARIVTVNGNFVGKIIGANGKGNGWHGLHVTSGSTGCFVAANTIVGNEGAGVRIDAGCSFVTFVRNRIGVYADNLTAQPNAGGGVIVSGCNNITIGGSTPGAGEGNTIAHSPGAGVAVNRLKNPASSGAGNAILGNNIVASGGLAIDLGNDGATANDAGDLDAGPNGFQNAPVFTAATVLANGRLSVSGTLHSKPNTRYRLEIFVRRPAQTSTNRFLGSVEVVTDAAGNGAFANAQYFLPLNYGTRSVTATATGPEGTSEESPNRAF